MLASQRKCPIRGIPRRLHTGTRKPKVVPVDDSLFVRHPPLPVGEPYHLEIPEHAHLEDQSANSDTLNTPCGVPPDVLYDTRYGRHERYAVWQIAKLPVAEILALNIPNKNTLVLNADGTVKADELSFEVVHAPEPCMYPHCVIYALKNGKRPREVASGFKTAVRSEFARIAEKYRQEMLPYQRRRQKDWASNLYRLWLLTRYRISRLLRSLGTANA